MKGPLFLAWRYILYHKLKTLIMIGCIFLTAFLPIAIGILLNQFNRKIVSRADSTPAIIGAKGSDLDLTLHALYFKNRTNDTIPYSHVQMIRDKGWAIPIPVYSRFTARGFPIVGTSLQYFDFRGLQVAEGSMLDTLGDCLIGASGERAVIGSRRRTAFGPGKCARHWRAVSAQDARLRSPGAVKHAR